MKKSARVNVFFHHSMVRPMRDLTGCLLCLVFAISECWSQHRDEPISASSDLVSLVSEEAKEGVYVFYRQSFIDKENKRASYRGSVYGSIQKFQLNGCGLTIESMIVDKFAGTVGNGSTGQMQDTFRYSANLTLTREIASGLAVIEARPAQLGRSTHSVCDEQPSCSFPWLRIQTKHSVIHEVSNVNDSLDFDGQVDDFVVPVSSLDMGNRLIKQVRTIAESRCH
jgi:hypothetical protein